MPIIVCESCGKVPSAFDTNNVLPYEIRAVKNETLQSEGEDDDEEPKLDVKVKGDLEVDGYVYASKDMRIGTKEDWESGKYFQGKKDKE